MMLILASASPRRKDLLELGGFKVDRIHPGDIDETPYKKEPPLHYVKRMAFEKCQAVFEQFPNDCVLAADTTVVRGRRIFGKPEDESQAREFMTRMSGAQHQVMTAMCVMAQGRKVLKFSRTYVKFKTISPSELDYFIQSNDWVGKAGGYAIQGVASSFVTRINGSVTGVIGLNLAQASDVLQSFGFKRT